MVVEMTVDGGGRVGVERLPRDGANKAKFAYNSVAAWLEGRGPMPAPAARFPGWTNSSASRIGSPSASKRAGRARGVGPETLEARPVTEGGAVAGMRQRNANRAKELIEDFMIAANSVMRASSTRPVSRSCGAWCDPPSAGSASWSWPPTRGETAGGARCQGARTTFS